MRTFGKFAVIDWSGQNVARPKGLAIAIAGQGNDAPALVVPPDRYWSRADVVTWLREHAEADVLIGLDLSPGLPFADHGSFFPRWVDSPTDAKALWATVERHSRESRYLSSNGFLAHPSAREFFLHPTYRGTGYAPANGRLRTCEVRQADMQLMPSSCFKLIGANQVGKSSLTGMRVLHQVNDVIPVWPFDQVPAGGALIVEIYTSIAALAAGRSKNRTKIRTWEDLDEALTHRRIASRPTGASGPVDDHSSDAILTAAWLRRAAGDPGLWAPAGLSAVARTEGWTFGVA